MDLSTGVNGKDDAVSAEYSNGHPPMNPAKNRHQLPSRIAVLSDRQVQPIPSTPPRPSQKAIPNSGKRRTAPNLHRSSPATSHHSRMSAIFEDAGRAINLASTPTPMTTATRRLRMPLAETSNLGITPSSPQPQDDDMIYPDLTALKSPVVRRHVTAIQHTPTCEDDLRTTHPGIHDWLNEIDGHDPLVSMKLDENSPTRQLGHPSPSPSKLPLPSRECPTIEIHSRSPERSCRTPPRFSHQLTPRGHLTGPSRRGKACLSPSKGTTPAIQDGSFEICEDAIAEKAVALSHSVQQHRKNRGPKRKRCISYWDNDILPHAITAAEKKSGESEERVVRPVLEDIPALTKAKGFVEGVENGKFDFEVIKG
ncbi:MAG: hypothetical protein Q9185_005283 [Variospora sp. 1 TL-2023]